MPTSTPPAPIAVSATGPAGVAAACAVGICGAFYLLTLARGYTWANHGADGGELLAAAATGGIPHPPGYPLYMLLLRGALALGERGSAQWEPAQIGNAFSAAVAAGAAGLTAYLTAQLVQAAWRSAAAAPSNQPPRIWSAAGGIAAGVAFGVTPILWSQALITEVYTLHALLIAALGLAAFTRAPAAVMAAIIGCGLAHHLTLLLVVPAAYWIWRRAPGRDPGRASVAERRPALAMATGAPAVAAAFYGYLLWHAGMFGSRDGPPPVLWGYPDSWQGFWWLISAAPYRGFVLGVPVEQWHWRLWAAGHILLAQFTLIGALAILIGIAHARRLGLVSLSTVILWCLPVLIYAATYNTTDSYLYLLPVVWFLSLWFGVGACDVARRVAQPWSGSRGETIRVLLSVAAVAFPLGLGAAGMPHQSLRDEDRGRRYIAAVAATVDPGSLVITSGDEHTFALWYAAWAGSKTANLAPGVALVNLDLYAHPWYRRLLRAVYPDLLAVGDDIEHFIAANAQSRVVWFTDSFDDRLPAAVLPGERVSTGPLWRYGASLPE